MGKYLFQKKKTKPSRTITATKIGTSREAIIYRSGIRSNGNGEFRTPTVREAACIMGFQSLFSISWEAGKQNKVEARRVMPYVPSVARHLLNKFRIELRLGKTRKIIFKFWTTSWKYQIKSEPFSLKMFSRFTKKKIRGQDLGDIILKMEILLFTLSNYDIDRMGKIHANGELQINMGMVGFKHFNLPDGFYKKSEKKP